MVGVSAAVSTQALACVTFLGREYGLPEKLHALGVHQVWVALRLAQCGGRGSGAIFREKTKVQRGDLELDRVAVG